MRGLRPGLHILDCRPLAPLRDRLWVDPQITAQRRERSLRSLYCCSDGVRGRGGSRDELVPYGFLPFQRKDRTIKPWDQTPSQGRRLPALDAGAEAGGVNPAFPKRNLAWERRTTAKGRLPHRKQLSQKTFSKRFLENCVISTELWE